MSWLGYLTKAGIQATGEILDFESKIKASAGFLNSADQNFGIHVVSNAALADDGTITLPMKEGILLIKVGTQGGTVAIAAADGACTILSGTVNLVATDTDAKACVFANSTVPTIKNRLGSAQIILGVFIYMI